MLYLPFSVRYVLHALGADPEEPLAVLRRAVALAEDRLALAGGLGRAADRQDVPPGEVGVGAEVDPLVDHVAVAGVEEGGSGVQDLPVPVPPGALDDGLQRGPALRRERGPLVDHEVANRPALAEAAPSPDRDLDARGAGGLAGQVDRAGLSIPRQGDGHHLVRHLAVVRLGPLG